MKLLDFIFGKRKSSEKSIQSSSEEYYQLGVKYYGEFDPDWREMLQKSADLGNADAAIFIGSISEKSCNFADAEKWYLRAKELSGKDADKRLGLLYQKSWSGGGNPHNEEKCEYYLSRCSGDAEAEQALRELHRRINNPDAVSRSQAEAIEDFSLGVLQNGFDRYYHSDEDKSRIDVIISWLEDPLQPNFSNPLKTAALLNFRLFRADMGRSFFDSALERKYNPVYELLIILILLSENEIDTEEITSRFDNILSYYDDFPEKKEEFAVFYKATLDLYEAVKINRPRLEDEMLRQKAVNKVFESAAGVYENLPKVIDI